MSAPDLHITLKYIGHWPESRLGEVNTVLADLAKHGPIDLFIEGVGCFLNATYPHVLWAGVKPAQPLRELAEALDTALARIGVPRELIKPYTPHVTVVRSDYGFIPAAVLDAISDADQPRHFGRFLADRFHLYRTMEGMQASAYKRLAEVSLSPPRSCPPAVFPAR